MKTEEKAKLYNEFLSELMGSIDSKGDSAWANEKLFVSEHIRDAVVEQIKGFKNQYDDRFLDYCNSIKSLLAVYNFGSLSTEESLLASGCDDDAKLKACRDRLASDKKIIKTGVRNILAHIESRGYDITPYINANDNATIFGNDDKDSPDYKKITGDDIITLSATTVMTTLTYFRRAVKRISLFSKEELTDDGIDLTERVAATLSDLLHVFTVSAVNNGYIGWGLTMSSRAVTLSDTYSVVDAISRFADAFMSDVKEKADDEFVRLVNSHSPEIAGRERNLAEWARATMYKVAYNTYANTRNAYGKSIFYFNAEKTADNRIVYNTSKTDYEQIASSTRSSALFNPLYVAMITMYGYNEKEIVIRRFMDDSDLVAQYYNDYELNCPDGMMKISEYSVKELKVYPDANAFADGAKMLLEPHGTVSGQYGQGIWSDYYKIARVFQKYVETQLPDDLMKIDEYRDYLNATKDAIDQVQVAYRNFDNAQRLGIVDTDYKIFSTLDIDTATANISMLNKRNISVNNLRPILLSSKIMIVNALVKYPQSDIIDLYNAIKATRHRRDTTVKKSARLRQDLSDTEWLWNEDDIDMNSTARHTEAVMYDYFDYYERYELGFKAVSSLKDGIDDAVSFADDGSLVYDGNKLESFGKAVLEISKTNIDRAKVAYNKKLAEKDETIAALRKQLDAANIKAEKDKAETEAKHREQLARLKTSVEIGDAVRDWIRAETERYLKDSLSYMILNIINGNRDDRNFSFDALLYPDDTIVDGNFEYAHELAEKIMADYNEDSDAAKRAYTDKFKNARRLQTLFDGALDGILSKDDIATIHRKENERGENIPLEERNKKIAGEYAAYKYMRKQKVKQNEPPARDDYDGDNDNNNPNE